MLITNIEIGTINGEVVDAHVAEANDDTNMIVIEYPSQSKSAVGFIAVSDVAVLNGLALMASIRRRFRRPKGRSGAKCTR